MLFLGPLLSSSLPGVRSNPALPPTMPELQARGLGKEEKWRWSEAQESVLMALE
jgi:hypothetical protein